jgi:hypothetical protein
MSSQGTVLLLQRLHLCFDHRAGDQKLSLPAEEAYIIRSLAGHIVAGVATDEEVGAFREFCERMDQSHAG